MLMTWMRNILVFKMIANSQGYICRANGVEKNRTWFFIKHRAENRGIVDIGEIYFPKHLIGRKIRLKMELIEEGKNV